MFYLTPGDEVPFEFRSKQVPYDKVMASGRYLIRINNCTYSIDGKPGLFKFSKPVNEFGNVEFVDEEGRRVLLREFMILDGDVSFYKSS